MSFFEQKRGRVLDLSPWPLLRFRLTSLCISNIWRDMQSEKSACPHLEAPELVLKQGLTARPEEKKERTKQQYVNNHD